MKVRNRILSFVLAMILLISVIPVNAFAAGDIMYGIGFTTGSDLRLRQQPSTSAKVLCTYKNGIRLEIIEQGETWCKVYGKSSGNIGYVMTKFVTLHGVPSVPVKTVQNGNTYVNLRSAPSKVSGAVYEKLYSGNQVVVLSPGDEWTQVRYGNTVGYMMTAFLK